MSDKSINSDRYRYYIMPKNTNALRRCTLVLILAGGEGSRLYGLTKWRAKPAVPFGGKYRIIDFALSNCVNSGLRRIGVLTQYKAHSLIRHLQRGWSFMRPEIGEFIELIPAQQRTADKHWYLGTADAIFQNLDILNRHAPEFIIVLGGDHIYQMDYTDMLLKHVAKEADITVGCIEVPLADAKGYGVMAVDNELNIIDFAEKPKSPEPIPGKPDTAMASMGIYIFSKKFLVQALLEDAEDVNSSHDFGKDIIPRLVQRPDTRVVAFPFQNENGEPAYWRDVGTVDSYWQANMELCDIDPELNLYDREWPVWTYQTQNPPAKFIFDDEGRRGEAIDSLVSAGCIISGARVKRSVIFFLSRVEEHSLVKDSVVLPKVTIGKNCRIQNTIIDKGCTIPDNSEIGYDLEKDSQKFFITDNGIRLVTPKMLGQDLYTGDLLSD